VKKLVIVAICLLFVVSAGWIVKAYAADSDTMKIASLVHAMKGMDSARLAALPAIPPQPYTLPKPGVDVMRSKLTETYVIDGVGEDTVELSGWIAVTHGKPSTDDWNTAVTDTQFVALELHGQSKLFGPILVTFDPEHPAVGQVGRITIPEKVHTALAAANAGVKAINKPKTRGPAADTDSQCRAPVSVAVSMPQLGLTMRTKTHAVWYSEVTTIPPVGHVASVTVDPIRLITKDGREVGTLTSGRVYFRETVRHESLSDGVDVTGAYAAATF
jgi:Family of unknown function (DUF6073)